MLGALSDFYSLKHPNKKDSGSERFGVICVSRAVPRNIRRGVATCNSTTTDPRTETGVTEHATNTPCLICEGFVAGRKELHFWEPNRIMFGSVNITNVSMSSIGSPFDSGAAQKKSQVVSSASAMEDFFTNPFRYSDRKMNTDSSGTSSGHSSAQNQTNEETQTLQDNEDTMMTVSEGAENAHAQQQTHLPSADASTMFDSSPLLSPRSRFQRRNAFCHSELLRSAVMCSIESTEESKDVRDTRIRSASATESIGCSSHSVEMGSKDMQSPKRTWTAGFAEIEPLSINPTRTTDGDATGRDDSSSTTATISLEDHLKVVQSSMLVIDNHSTHRASYHSRHSTEAENTAQMDLVSPSSNASTSKRRVSLRRSFNSSPSFSSFEYD